MTGVDISDDMLALAKLTASRDEVNVSFIQGDMRSFDLGEKFQFIFNPAQSLSHLHTREEIENCFSCVRKHLADNGHFLIELYMVMVDSLCTELRRFLEIKSLEGKANYDCREVYPKSPEALRYFQEGLNQVLNSKYKAAITTLEKAHSIDSTFTFASFQIAFAYCFGELNNWPVHAGKWIEKAYTTKEKLPLKYQYWLEMWYACLVSKNPQDVVKFCGLLETTDIESRFMWFDLGVTYYSFTTMMHRSFKAFERVDEISKQREVVEDIIDLYF